jgi:hypothetical protein
MTAAVLKANGVSLAQYRQINSRIYRRLLALRWLQKRRNA